jgi:hypothetical protein
MSNRCAGNPPLHEVGKADWNGWGNGAGYTVGFRLQEEAAGAARDQATDPKATIH